MLSAEEVVNSFVDNSIKIEKLKEAQLEFLFIDIVTYLMSLSTIEDYQQTNVTLLLELDIPIFSRIGLVKKLINVLPKPICSRKLVSDICKVLNRQGEWIK